MTSALKSSNLEIAKSLVIVFEQMSLNSECLRHKTEIEQVTDYYFTLFKTKKKC